VRIGWILSEVWLSESPAGLYSSMASYRYRAIIPGTALTRLGHEVSIMGLVNGPESLERGTRFIESVDVVVFGKMFQEGVLMPPLLAAARAAGKPAVVDICDEFLEPSYAAMYQEALPRADAVTTSSSFLTGRIAEMTGCRATVIADPYEGPRGAPRWEPRERLEVAWFGNVINLVGLEVALPGLLASRIPMHLVVVTDLTPIARAWESARRPEVAPAIELDVRQWSLEATARALRECDAAVLPIDRSLNFYLSKGPDRMIEALWAGRYVAAHPLPAYEEFRDWAWMGEEVAEGLAWALAHPGEITGRVARAQEHIEARYAPAVVGATWGDFLARVRGGRGRET
jgi:hypothetical protein